MTHILMIGSDRHFAEACVARGIDLVVVRNTSAASVGFPDAVRELTVADQTGAEQVIGALTGAGVRLSDFDGVHTDQESCGALVALLARAAGLPGPDLGTVTRMRDKSRQRDAVRAAGVPVTPSRRFVNGAEYVLDGWVHRGTIGFSSLGHYSIPCLQAVASDTPIRRYRYPAGEETELRWAATELAEAAFCALGLHHGVFHLEFFRDRDTGDLVFSECAAHRGGGLTEEEVRRSSGVSLADATVDLVLGRRPDHTDPCGTDLVGTVLLPAGAVLASAPNAGRLDRYLNAAQESFLRGSPVAPVHASPRASVGVLVPLLVPRT